MGAHIAVAEALHRTRGVGRHSGPRSAPDPGELLGSALPDLASMGRFRLSGRSSHEGLTRGIGLHHRTDDVFHRHPWFLERQRQLMADLTGQGFRRGPAMACGHVGIELLLDGALLSTGGPVGPAVRRAFELIPSAHIDLGSLVDPPNEPRWLAHLERFAGRPPLAGLDDPVEVAGRLFRIVSARPLLAFDGEQRPLLAAALDRQRPLVAAAAQSVVDEIVAQLVSTDA